ncbi:MAG: alanine--tRNA ligase [Candidatus Portnoybacteria bacterium CG10_big_fil_rev_8_21_14_0_10_36_7]|uniref:Alanine--tRNA ligase n=1 Tax=Candidatus Portnoybacteria bacterium CG10_big_fil_rev_8_21_14_0_10_36_7 TaxID=1974812 RepID=A0A2M8KEL4_9BACT|nr:MAG: alanine--tRNA ligase [Candidatus Portnoybacteria bacterium CG10_big_fil_rev_8_21_14_0_10_36_7]
MTANELRQKYLEFFKSKGHIIIPSASLVPENDPSTLFTGSGMQPMVPYLLGEKHPLGTRIVDSQKCFRAGDIEDVGDNRHTTFFEMLGNWSLGDYFKKEQIFWMFEFLTKEIGLDPKNVYVTVFRGNEELGISRDSEAAGFWKEEFSKIGIEAKDVDFVENKGMQEGRIFYYGKDNWWSRVGVPDNMPIGEPGGPDSEMFWDFGAELGIHEKSEYRDQVCHVNCDCGRFLEIGNNVFMQYVKTEKGFEQLPSGNIDFGGGLERILAAKNGDPDIFKTDLFVPIIGKIEKLSGEKYGESVSAYDMRVIADHLKAATFLIADGVVPSNTQQGYVLRRLIRRAIRYGHLLGIEKNFTKQISEAVVEIYKDIYSDFGKNKIFVELENEENRFRETLEKGLKEFEKMQNVSGADAFNLYQTYGFPLEMTEELALEKGIKINKKEFEEEFKKHQEKSRTASAGQFKGGLVDVSEITIKYHTATHLLLAAMRQILSPEIYQKGSNITAERLRFDFNYPEKLSAEQLKSIENLVNEKIGEKIEVEMMEMSKEEALKLAKVSFDPSKYGDIVKVYKINDFSTELCGGPHVKNTGELGKFRITKEEASSAGVRRIKAVLV